MNRYILIRRLTGPAILLLIGVLALLSHVGVIESWWHLFWPLLLILIGVLKLAERAALANEDYSQPYAGVPYQGYPNQPYPGAPQQSPVTETSIVPAHPNDDDVNGGRS